LKYLRRGFLWIACPIMAIAFSYHYLLSELFFIRSPLICLAQSHVELPPSLIALTEEPLTLSGMGSQCMVFSSPSSPYLCKICKAGRYQLPLFLEWLPLRVLEYKKQKKQRRREQDFLSYLVAHEYLQEQTGITYVHLAKTSHLQTSLRVQTPLGFIQHLSCDDLLFYVQKRASPLLPFLQKSLQEKRFQELHAFFYTLFSWMRDSCQKGLFIKDIKSHHLMKNLGVLEGKPLWMDPGRIEISNTFKDPIRIGILLKESYEELCSSLLPHYPELLSIVEEAFCASTHEEIN